MEETVEETVKEEVEEKAFGAGRWVRVFWGAREAGSMQDLPWDTAVLAGSHPPNLDHPLLVPPESPIWTPRFWMHRVHHKILGQGRWVWADKGGGPPGQTAARGGGGVPGTWWWQPELPGRKWGEAPPPSEKEVKMFELAQLNVFSPELRKGGASHWRFIAMCWQAMGLGGMECVGRTWTWTPTWLAIMEIGGFDWSPANRGCVPDWCTASPPAQSPSPRSPQPP